MDYSTMINEFYTKLGMSFEAARAMALTLCADRSPDLIAKIGSMGVEELNAYLHDDIGE